MLSEGYTCGSAAYHLPSVSSLTDDEQRFFTDLWQNSSPDSIENVIIMQGSGKKKLSRSLNKILRQLNNEDTQTAGQNASLDRFFKILGKRDAYFTPNTFSPSGKQAGSARKDNLYAVYSWALDIDYKADWEREYDRSISHWTHSIAEDLESRRPADALSFWTLLKDNLTDYSIPMPNYVEYGHQLRLIYLLPDPIKAGIPSGKKLIYTLEQIMQRFCTILNEHEDCGAEPQKLSSYYRIPGSINSKDSSTIHLLYVQDERYTVQDLLDGWMPNLPEWYGNWKNTPHKKKSKKTVITHTGNIAQIHNAHSMRLNRMDALKALRSYPGIPREKLTFIFGATYQEEFPEEDVRDALYEFNDGFPEPLPSDEIRSKFRTLQEHQYYFKTETIASELGITLETLQEYGMGVSQRKRERQAKIDAGETRQQKAEQTYKEYCRLREEGKTEKEAAEGISRTIRTAKRLEARRKNEKARSKQTQLGSLPPQSERHNIHIGATHVTLPEPVQMIADLNSAKDVLGYSAIVPATPEAAEVITKAFQERLSGASTAIETTNPVAERVKTPSSG